MTSTRARLSLVEYGSPVDLVSKITEAIEVDRLRSGQLLHETGLRVRSSLGFSYNPINVDATGVRAIDFAGLIRLGPSLELEVVPKFLGLDDTDTTWREDFFFLSTLSQHGHLLASERLATTGGTPRDLSTLIARAMVSMHETHKRRPLRTYRRQRTADFFIEGDPDPTDLVFPSADGFEQKVTRFDKNNTWNADISAAAKELLPEVSDPVTASALVRLIEDLGPQRQISTSRKPIPSRHRAWKPLHQLSLDVLRGLGLTYRVGQSHAPGYVVDTWRVWEDLLTIGVRLGFGRNAVFPQKGFTLGTRKKLGPDAKIARLSVYPDCVIEAEGARPRILLDAKYKGHAERDVLRIAEADVYESLAFAKASKSDLVVLAYPALASQSVGNVGSCLPFEHIEIDGVQIVGIQIEIRKIHAAGALQKFANNLATGIESAFE